MRKPRQLQCPDCDTPLPIVARNKRTGKLKYLTGVYPCTECDSTLVVTEVADRFSVRVRTTPRTYFPPKSKTATQHCGIEIDYHPDWLPSRTVPVPDAVTCVHCHEVVQSVVNTIRARIFKGFIEKMTEGPLDPTTGLPRQEVLRIPSFDIGRLCRDCQCNRLTGVSGRPPRRNEFEYLHERVTLRKKRVVTVGSMLAFDIAKQREKDMEGKKYVDLGDVLIRAEDLEDSTLEKFEEVDVRAYRALHKMSGKRRRYDPDLNKDNSRLIK